MNGHVHIIGFMDLRLGTYEAFQPQSRWNSHEGLYCDAVFFPTYFLDYNFQKHETTSDRNSKFKIPSFKLVHLIYPRSKLHTIHKNLSQYSIFDSIILVSFSTTKHVLFTDKMVTRLWTQLLAENLIIFVLCSHLAPVWANKRMLVSTSRIVNLNWAMHIRVCWSQELMVLINQCQRNKINCKLIIILRMS